MLICISALSNSVVFYFHQRPTLSVIYADVTTTYSCRNNTSDRSNNLKLVAALENELQMACKILNPRKENAIITIFQISAC